MTGFVICRLEPNTPNGCIYWSGSIACEPDERVGTQMFIGEAVSRHNVLVVSDEHAAHGLAMWLNTSPVISRRHADQSFWQALPLGQFIGRAA